MKVFAKKATALKYLKQGTILCNDDIKKYFIMKDYNSFRDLIKSKFNPNYYEFIHENDLLNFFLDIEIYRDKNPDEYNNHIIIVKSICELLKQKIESLDNLSLKFIILESHLENVKRSYHIIIRIYKEIQDEISKVTKFNQVYFKNVKSFKKMVVNLFNDLCNSKIIDISVYREGLFRTYCSTKSGEIRPLIKSNLSDEFDFLETFVCYCPNEESSILLDTKSIGNFVDNTYNIDKDTRNDTDIENCVIETSVQKNLTQQDCDIIKKFVRKYYKQKIRDIREILIDKKLNCIIIALNDTFCFNIDREHNSNHQYIVIDVYSSKQKCHDIDCSEYKHDEIKINKFPKELNEIILKCLKVNKNEQELIHKAIEECKDYITENFDTSIDEIQFDKLEMVFRGDVSQNSLMKMIGKCPECHVEHQIGDSGYCLKCKVCKSIFPKNTLIPIDDRYKQFLYELQSTC